MVLCGLYLLLPLPLVYSLVCDGLRVRYTTELLCVVFRTYLP
jgi:hypothetical protein